MTLFVFWIFWLPGIRVATDFHVAERSVQLTSIFPWVWKETAVADGLGEYYALSLWSQPIHTLFGLLAMINIPYEIQTKLFGFLILIIGFFGIWKLLDKFNINNGGKSVGSIFFLLNSFFLLLFDGGQLSLALAYSTLPIVIYYFLISLETNSLRAKLKFTLAILFLSIFDIRIVYLAFLVILFFLILKVFTDLRNSFVLIKKLFLSAIITGIILASFHAFWLLPALTSKPIQLPQTYERTSQVIFLSFSSLSHSLLLQQPHWPQNVFGRITVPSPEFILIPLLVFSVLILVRKNAIVAFWLLVSVISIFLSKGSNEPFPEVYPFLFNFLPGFSLFRDPTKFYFLICLSYSILLGFAVQAIMNIRTANLTINKIIKVIPFLLVLYLIFLVRPLYLGQMNGMFSFPKFQREFEQLTDILKNDENYSRVFWIPMKASLGYVSNIHPSVQATTLSQKRPFAVGSKGTYETFNFLREAPYMGEIFDVAGIGYIVDPYLDSRRDDMHPDNIRYYYTFLDQLSDRSWLSRVNNSLIPLLKTKQHQEKFFITSDVWLVIGSDDIYNDATKSAKLKLSKNALIFAEEHFGLGRKIDELPTAKIVLNHKTDLDLAASLIDFSNLIFPAENLGFTPDKSGWWKRESVDVVWWRSFLQEKYGIDNQDFDLGGGWAIGEGDLNLRVQSAKFQKDKILLARVMDSSKSGSLKIYQGDKIIGEVSTKKEGEANIRWFEVGKISSEDQTISIKSEGDINVINALAVVDQGEWSALKKKIEVYKEKGRIIEFNERNTNDLTADVTFQQINPTKYKVSVSGLTKPGFLIFSQNFDSLWKLKNQSALPVFSILNGFQIESDGDYIIEFEPQKYVYPGLVISVVTTMIVLLLIIKTRKTSP